MKHFGLFNRMTYTYRLKLSPDLQFVVLDMDIEQQVERISGRHGGRSGAINLMKVRYSYYLYLFPISYSCVIFMDNLKCLKPFFQNPWAEGQQYLGILARHSNADTPTWCADTLLNLRVPQRILILTFWLWSVSPA